MIKQDPEKNEIRALLDLADITGSNVLEIGSGDGRLTWRYAPQVAHVVAIEPFEPSYKRAMQDMPTTVHDRVELLNATFEDFAAVTKSATFDVAILSWSLC